MSRGIERVNETAQKTREITMATNQQKSAASQVVLAMKEINHLAMQFASKTKETFAASAGLEEHAVQFKELTAEYRLGGADGD